VRPSIASVNHNPSACGRFPTAVDTLSSAPEGQQFGPKAIYATSMVDVAATISNKGICSGIPVFSAEVGIDKR